MRQTDRQTDRQTVRQVDRQTETEREKKKEKDPHLLICVKVSSYVLYWKFFLPCDTLKSKQEE